MRTSSFLPIFAAFFLLPTINQAQSVQPKRPMTFEDMMQMKRLGDTAVSADGKWLGYSVTTVDLKQNTKTQELWVQAIARVWKQRPIQAGRGPAWRRRHRSSLRTASGFFS